MQQENALQERIGWIKNKDTEEEKKEFFPSTKIQTVDSFQGDKKDIIILSTVRCNGDGNMRFFDSNRRANVALTRAKYVHFSPFLLAKELPLDPLIVQSPTIFFLNYFSHRNNLWILGHEATLIKSNSIWSELVRDAKNRLCFFDTDTDSGLAQAIKDFKSMQKK
jgi:senataxin